MTQALLDASQLQPLLDHYAGTMPIPVLVGIWPLRRLALRFPSSAFHHDVGAVERDALRVCAFVEKGDEV